MAKRKFNEFDLSAMGNDESYNFYVNRMIELSVAMFDWQNLPETCDERYIETVLFNGPGIVFFEEPDIGLLSLTYTQRGGFDVYGYPISVNAYSRYNSFRRTLKSGEFVICYNNMLKQPSMQGAIYYAKRLWALDRIIDINANAQKTPLLIQGSDKDRLSLMNLYKEYTGNAPAIFGNKSLDPESLRVLKTDAPYLADKLYELKSDLWNEALTFLGISNVNVTKKERMITDEVIRAQGGTIASRYSRLETRQKAADKVNKLFGTDIKVEFREDTQPEVAEEDMPEREEDIEEVRENG